jgi:DinB superfamily
MDPSQVVRDANNVMRCRECGFTYNLAREEVVSRAGSGLATLQEAVDSTPEDRRSVRPAPTVWSINAYSAHLADSAGVINLRVRAIAETVRPELLYHDQDQAVEDERADQIPTSRSLPQLEESVQAFQWYLAALPASAWDRVGIHSRAGEVRLSDIAHDMAHELEHHTADIRRIGSSLTS